MRVLVTEADHYLYISFPGGVGPDHRRAIDCLKDLGARRQLPTRIGGWRWRLPRARRDDLERWLMRYSTVEDVAWVTEVVSR